MAIGVEVPKSLSSFTMGMCGRCLDLDSARSTGRVIAVKHYSKMGINHANRSKRLACVCPMLNRSGENKKKGPTSGIHQ